ncbi:hypothetical protein GDO86_015938 [Hymenochirus boettgeri]|uniref:Zinc finger CCCH domain-containing protein 14 n=1 Tax=Hymenochirus boettgeri TaxID=247094 RepID=A0A8T2JV05_9PIPI|nr:hypothetical protein GDO86_015938 [Hymenochirus boettgeri]
MEIGTEISRKIRTAIKGKLQELGAYMDEELPDYIMVMVANKKSQKQMTDDLSLFLGSNTSRFTTWLQGVLDKLRSVTPEPKSIKDSDAVIFESNMQMLKCREDVIIDCPALTVSSTRHESYESSTNPHGRTTSGTSAAMRLTSAVRPLQELSPSEAVIDIKLDLDDPFNEDLSFAPDNALVSKKRPGLSASYRTLKPTAEIYRPPGSGQHAYYIQENNSLLQRLPKNNIAPEKSLKVQGGRPVGSVRLKDSKGASGFSETYWTALHLTAENEREEEASRKRRLPMASSIVKVKKLSNDGEEEVEEEEEEEDYIFQTTGISSSVSVPSRLERRPTLPPSKQANKNLILKAISEAQESVTKTTRYSAVPQKQTVPVAPRSRILSEEEISLMQNRMSMLTYPTDFQQLPEQQKETITGDVQRMDLLSRLQTDLNEEVQLGNTDSEEAESMKSVDSRSFILKRNKLFKEPSQKFQNTSSLNVNQAQPLPGRLIQPREVPPCEEPESPKFIVTLDGVPSPPGYASDQEVEEEAMCITEQGESYSEQCGGLAMAEEKYPLQLVAEPLCSTDVVMENVSGSSKEKLRERCKYWPACKNADSCAYHHPTTVCKAFPKCRFAEKCFFIHPNCKFDAKCTKADCPFTHASKRFPVPQTKPVSVPSSQPGTQICRYFPACKKTDCLFYHPKHCRFNNQCTRPDCKFYHPSVSVPPRHALTWTRAQAR